MKFATLLLLAGVAGVAIAEADANAKPKAEAKAEADHPPPPRPAAPAYPPKQPEYPRPYYPPQRSYSPSPPSYPVVYPPPHSPYPSYPSYPPPPSYPHYPQHPSYPPPPPSPYYEEKCTTKEWSSETELCLPNVVQSCENLDVRVKKVRDPKTMCRPAMIPKCKVDNTVKEVRICNTRVINRRATLYATLYEQEMVVRCNTHYETKCQKTYGYRPRCYSVPIKNCYDLPHLTKVNMPIRVSVAETKEDCLSQRIPTPRTVCWEEEVMLCPSVPQLVEKEQVLLKCGQVLTNNDCKKVKLTIPKEVCYPEEKYYPYHHPRPRPAYPPPYPAKKL